MANGRFRVAPLLLSLDLLKHLSVELDCDFANPQHHNCHRGAEDAPGETNHDHGEGVAKPLGHLLSMLIMCLLDPIYLDRERNSYHCTAYRCLHYDTLLQSLERLSLLHGDQPNRPLLEVVEEQVGCRLPQKSDNGRDQCRAQPVKIVG